MSQAAKESEQDVILQHFSSRSHSMHYIHGTRNKKLQKKKKEFVSQNKKTQSTIKWIPAFKK